MSLKYSELREFVHNGDCLAFSGKWSVSKIITWWQKWKYPNLYKYNTDDISHVGLAIWIEIGGVERLCVMESTGKGVNIYPLSYLLKKYSSVGGKIYFQPLKANTLNGEVVMEKAMSMWGFEYSPRLQYYVLGSNFFRRIYRWFTGKDGDVDSNKVTCSEFVATAYRDSGYVHDKIPALTSPIEVVNFSCLGEPVLIEND